MRHDPASAAVVVMLRGLKMYGMAEAASDLIEQGAPAFDTAVPILSQLLKAEMAERFQHARMHDLFDLFAKHGHVLTPHPPTDTEPAPAAPCLGIGATAIFVPR